MQEPQDRVPFLTADWKNIIVVNFDVRPELLEPHVPRGTELHAYQGTHFVSLVGFLFDQLRWKGVVSAGPLRSFEEVNIRFYVRRRVDGEERHGVCFLRELVPSRIIAWVANCCYDESYSVREMSHSWNRSNREGNPSTGEFEYTWSGDNRTNRLNARTDGELQPSRNGTLAKFILDHYWGYTTGGNGETYEYRVNHPSWRYWNTSEVSVEADVRDLVSDELAEVLTGPPHSSFIAEGSEVEVFGRERIKPR